MNKNFDEVLNEGIFKSEKNTLGGEDLKIVNDAIHYMKYVKAYAEATTGKKFVDPYKTESEVKSEAFVPKPMEQKDLKKPFWNKDEKIKYTKLLNTAVIRYQDLYQKMFQLLGKYTQLQKIYGPYTNNNQMFANMFDCPTWEERKGMGKFSTDEQILANLEKFKKNLEKLINSNGQVFDKKHSKTVSKLLQDPTIKSKYSPELLDKIVKNLQLESINESEELDLDTEKEKSLEILKSLLIKYSDSEERMQKLADPKNVEKIKAHISSKIQNEPSTNDLEIKALSNLRDKLLGTGDNNSLVIKGKKNIVQGLISDVENEIKSKISSSSVKNNDDEEPLAARPSGAPKV